MALLRYTLRDRSEKDKVDVQASWYEELYYGPVLVENGYCRVEDDAMIFVLCNRGFEIVDESEKPTAEVEPTDVDDETDDEIVVPSEDELKRMTRPELNAKAAQYGVIEDAESFDTKPELIAAIVAANEEVGE